ncbi:bi-domain-containing oxidoreductase [Bythopirellula polymerisocia]|uniref:bi-domain-containing oxidoreductase n=1 Tax=Bythopirellula polymerisocia TaxID=2528003 RepID=UPI0018D2B6BF|nr:bi-domain-containing oxidoreductase [Bythopirellula polymerisocia]
MHEVPAPAVAPGEVLIANQASLVSAGTEKMVMDLAKKSLLGKARERPDHVRRVLEKVHNEGLVSTYRQVRQKLEEPLSMGYSSAGVVIACGQGVQDFKPGDRVASNGPHAEVVSVPRNLCARVPENVSLESAAFGVLGSIALQGVRLTQTTLGETVLVIGLGLVGQLTVALLKAAGVRVLGVDPDASRCELAVRMGADVARPDLGSETIEQLTGGLGADAVVITASTKSNGPIEMAAGAVRQKGRIVLVGVVGLELDRRPFYFKECEFVVSCSYGPGRYDASYEERGQDYPAAYVRWTEQRNIQAVLDLMGAGRLDVGPLISHRFEIGEAARAYEIIESGSEAFLGMVLEYGGKEVARREARGGKEVARREALGASNSTRHSFGTSIRLRAASGKSGGKSRCGVLGVGNFARGVMLPAMRDAGAFEIAAICSAKGVSAAQAAKTYNAEVACTDEEEIFGDPSIDTVFSFTRHDLHARHVLRAIQTGKNIFVEKPLCLTVEELGEVEGEVARREARGGKEVVRREALGAREEGGELSAGGGRETPLVMVGFNRRFSPSARLVREHFAQVAAPLTVSIRFNAGDIPAEHWTQQDEEGGGRIIGEACHAIDLATYLCGAPVVRVFAESVGGDQPGQITDDQCFITLRHANGSISNIAYLAGGDRAFPKERVEVLGAGRVAVIDDFHTVTTYHGGKKKVTKGKQQKGHAEEIAEFANAIVAGGEAPIPWEELRATSLAAILAVRSLREGGVVEVSG